ncbi:TonB-dependent receptor [Steroidobacter sp.]|uniref:TonB-dependent receptor n=1 Tax=Steroidobacter sp. TaxID=1978227 RepID=UPI001A57DFA3|nr:TonB-dependent receptor [Steroidobacter sp.]MBL8269706.1 TonB-dependent receptor [Steroidobacter sp.]
MAVAIAQAVAPGVCSATDADAGEAGSDSTLQTIVVTAQKRSENIQRVPSAVTALLGADILDDELRSTKDIAKEVPGATSWNAESRARPRFFIRGVGSNEATNNAVQPIGIYADEVYYLNSLFLGGPLFDLGRVEVLRGPQGTLWGKNTTGGAYNFVSKQPEFTTDGYAKLGIGNYGQRLVEAALGGPIYDDVLAHRFAVHYDKRGGLATNRVNGEEVGTIEDKAARYLLKAQVTQDLTATLNLHARSYSGDSTPTYAVTRPGVAAYDGYVSPYVSSGDRSVVDYGGESTPTEVDTVGANLKIEYAFGDLTLTSISAFDSGERSSAVSNLANTPTVRSYSYGTNDSDQWSQELRLTSDPSGRISWIAGVYFFRDENHNYSASATLLPVSAATRALNYSEYEQETESRAAFGSVTVDVTDRISITGGLRYTEETVGIDLDTYSSVQTVNGTVPFTNSNWWRGTQYAGLPLQLVATQHREKTWDNLGFDLTPQFTISDTQLAYVRVATGYRSGNYAGGASLGSPPVVVEPEKLLAYEVGYKSSWFDDRLTLNAAAYYYDYKDIQLTVNRIIDGVFRSILSNAGEGTVKGIELEARAQITPNLNVHGNISSLRTEYTELVTGTTSYAGYNFARVPDVTGLIGADYNISLPAGQLRFGADWAYTGEHNFNITDNTDPFVVQKGYWLGSLRASYQLPGGKSTIGAYVSNVTDKDYKVQAQLYSNGFYPTRLGDPRTYGLTLTNRF